jgi:hypothetical protein
MAASPGLAGHADRAYPGAHIDFGILDTERAKMFESDLDAHGLAIYTYLTLPDDHTAGSRAGFYTPESFIANNDAAFGSIVAALSKRPEWQSTNRFVAPTTHKGRSRQCETHAGRRDRSIRQTGRGRRRALTASRRFCAPSKCSSVCSL